MIYFLTVLSGIVYLFYSLMFFKIYQLNGYKIKSFFHSIFNFELSFGDKNKLKFTRRMVRFTILNFLLLCVILFLINYFTTNFWIVFLNYLVLFLLVPLVITVAHFFIWPLEEVIKKSYILKAKKKLKKLNIIKIGITGSYGKTSTKNILKTLLEKEYKVCVTPKNYNTEMGLTKTILDALDDHDILIAEMGARHKGDIEALAKLVKPNFGIITTIGPQHLQTFKNLQTVEETKFELAKNLDENGIMIFNGDSKSTKKLYSLYQGEKYLSCDEDGFAYVKNLKITKDGSLFDMHINGEVIKCKTKLLGKCNINNIVTASTLAYLLGITKEDLQSAIKLLEPSPHRLEMIKNGNVTIIDDSYNSNLIGASEALDVLSKFEGKKIVVSPGIVEMGQKQSEVNFKLGTMIADVADFFLIMNETNKNDLLSGAIAHSFKRKNIFFAQTRKSQKEILNLLISNGCVVLFINDLPDNYK